MLSEASKQKLLKRIEKLTKDKKISLDTSFSIQPKDGIFQCVIKYQIEGQKKWETFWATTGIKDVGGNNRETTKHKRLANKEAKEIADIFQNEIAKAYEGKQSKVITLEDMQKLAQLNTTNYNPNVETKADWDFYRYMKFWLDNVCVNSVAKNTFRGYKRNVEIYMKEYFSKKENKRTVKELSAEDIESFYNFLRTEKNLKNSSIDHYNKNISKGFAWLLQKKLVKYNPIDMVSPIKIEDVEVNTYNKAEINTLFEKLKGDPIELPSLFASYYGLRRSEILGLRIEVFDFEENYFVINHVALEDDTKDTKNRLYFLDKTKSKKGYRTLPLFKEIKDAVLKKIKRIDECKQFFGSSYNHEYDGYLFVHDNGDFIRPNYFTKRFGKLIKRYDLNKITPHGLRHTNATLLHMEGVDIRDLQDWLGHQSISSTNRYTRSDYQKQLATAQAVKRIFDSNNNVEENKKMPKRILRAKRYVFV